MNLNRKTIDVKRLLRVTVWSKKKAVRENYNGKQARIQVEYNVKKS